MDGVIYKKFTTSEDDVLYPFIELQQYVDEFCPEELAEEIYLRAYRKFGGQC